MYDHNLDISDHLPVEFIIELCALLLGTGHPAVKEPVPMRKKRLRWDKANLSTYYNLSFTNLTHTINQLDHFYARIPPDCILDPAPGGACCGGQLDGLRADAISLIEGVYGADVYVYGADGSALRHGQPSHSKDGAGDVEVMVE